MNAAAASTIPMTLEEWVALDEDDGRSFGKTGLEKRREATQQRRSMALGSRPIGVGSAHDAEVVRGHGSAADELWM